MNQNTVELPMAQDFSLSPQQSLAYSPQVAEVASPIVSSTSHPETEASPNQTMMVQVRASNCIPKQTDNIGSIITMLIDDQNVDIEDILTEEQYRQDNDHHHPGQDRQQQQGDIQGGYVAATVKPSIPAIKRFYNIVGLNYIKLLNPILKRIIKPLNFVISMQISLKHQ